MHRLIPAAAVIALFAFQAQAQTDTQAAPAAQAPAAAAPAQTAPATTPMKAKKHRQTLQQRFDAANSTHDGHLTKDQAAAANWPYVTNNFATIDKDRKGYVTVQDIHAFAKARHAAAHHKATPASTQPAQPKNG